MILAVNLIVFERLILFARAAAN